ncbi:hypothetical protein DCS32_14240 [Dokdonia sp. Dokd-P16]|uniref:hypothetical protein n=1 Tax=Dokdonia sp. Dokd-P16 TaxID=2173169 RepID=UPI000D544F64|nr:hypothetical protein [Dokdonia sp. Dokd-P16]AWH75282.1 hypothetical protein DCS32_14240 [Dokdonia sp. Dokd-P16]
MDKYLYTLLTFTLSIISGVIGYYLKQLIDKKKSKNLKILNVDLSIAQACSLSHNPKGYLPSRLSVKLENLSQTDITVKSISLKHRKHLDIFPAQMITDNENTIKQYEIKTFSYKMEKDIINQNSNNEIINVRKKLLELPTEFIGTLYWYVFNLKETTKSRKEFDKKIKGLMVKIYTNIGEYERKLKRNELNHLKQALDKFYPNQ